MNTIRYLLAAVLAIAADSVCSGQTILPSDVGVSLTATPSTNLVPGQPIGLVLTVTNYGPSPITELTLFSSIFVDEFHLISEDLNECNLLLIVEDLKTGGFDYFTDWNVSGAAGPPPLAVGETRTCHFQLALTAQAPAVMPYSFGLPSGISDPNPSNDRATVQLQQAPPPPPESILTLSPAMLLLLAVSLAAIGRVAHRRLSSSS